MGGLDILQQKILEWENWDRNETTRAALKELIKSNNHDQLKSLMLERIKFGTAGLRGKMDVGYSNMNDLVIIQTVQGWLRFLETERKTLLAKNGIVIGYDGRHNSKRWAEITACIFARAGYKVNLFGKVCPTPFVSYGIKKFATAGGVMVTASHNPKEDNGYKVYDSNACQIISPIDKIVHNLILNNLEPWESSWDLSILHESSLITDGLSQLTKDYIQLISSSITKENLEVNKTSNLQFVYTALHGVGYPYMKAAFDVTGLKLIPVKEQQFPDPDFPTVRFPNPEEGEDCLNLSIKAAEAIGSQVVVANDPDADRFAFAEKNSKTGSWKIFNGNELGALFGWWMIHCYQLKYPNEPMSNVYMLSSTVSSMILKTMAKHHKFNFIDTLTGFKWMGNKTIELHKQNKTVLLGYEVELGFMCIPEILDKDGVSAAVQFATFCSHIYRDGKQVIDKLDEIYSIYGFHMCKNSYFTCTYRDVIQTIFHKIRNYSGENSYPTHILNGQHKIVSIRDLTTGYDSNEPDKQAKLPLSPEMVTFTFDNGFIITLRTSGTEAKIKYYSELCSSPAVRDKQIVSELLEQMVKGVLLEFLQPNLYNLTTHILEL